MARRARLDSELVRRGLATSRREAQRAIDAGVVKVDGMPALKAAALVDTGQAITISEQTEPFVSRGGRKLDGALARWAIPVAGRRWLDAGASTGGFTDRLLQGGASYVLAVDVGYGQLDWRLRNDDRVVVLERVNVRTLAREDVPWRPEGVVADLSFISLSLVLPALARVARHDADFVLLVKPQFEVGKESVPRGGVVRDPRLWARAIDGVVLSGAQSGLGVAGVAPSDVPGPAGNREFFLHLRRGVPAGASDIGRAIEGAVAEAAGE
ncbi:16S/23S rRNA (cytidine-2'-O)-methyltransferase TlyA [soil metagenome]